MGSYCAKRFSEKESRVNDENAFDDIIKDYESGVFSKRNTKARKVLGIERHIVKCKSCECNFASPNKSEPLCNYCNPILLFE